MAISHICGFEMGSTSEAQIVTGTVSVQSSTVRSGSYAMRANPSAATGYLTFSSRAAAGSNRSLYLSVRFYLRIATLPSANTYIAGPTGNANRLRLDTDGKLTINSTIDGATTSSNALTADGLWHRIDYEKNWNAGAGMRVFVDGVEWASQSTTQYAQGTDGFIGSFTTGTTDLYFDDVAWYDSALPQQYLTTFEGTSNAQSFGTVATPRRGQSFDHPGGVLHIVEANLYKVGAPTDNVVVEIQTDSGGVPSGTVVGSSAIYPGSNLATSNAGQWIPFSVACGSQTAGTYWIVARRAGATSDTNYFRWNGPDAGGYVDGTGATYNGTTWSTVAVDHNFRTGTGLLATTLTDYNVYLLQSSFDQAIDGWLQADGTGTSLWTGLDNKPPVGSTGSSNATRIENVVSSTTDDYDALCQSYYFVQGGSYYHYYTGAVIANVGITSFVKRSNRFLWESSNGLALVTAQLAKVGSPTDELTISIQGDSAQAPNGVVLASTTVPASSLTTSFAPISVPLAAALVKGTIYHVVFERTGSLDAANYYTITQGPVGSPTGGAVYNGSTWNTSSHQKLGVGLRDSDSDPTILAIQAICNDAQAVTTGSPKAGAIAIASTQTMALDTLAKATVTVRPVGQSSAVTKVGQKFVAAASVTVDTIQPKMSMIGTNTDNFVFEIQGDSSGVPDGVVMGTASIVISTMTSTGTFYNLALDSTVSLVSGTTYWVVAYRSGAFDVNNYPRLYVTSSASTYANGVSSTYNGSTWTNDAEGDDFAIRVLSNPQTEYSFDYGLPNGTSGSTSAAAMGTFPAGWGTHIGPVTENPLVTLTSGPTVRVGKRSATTREVDVDALNVYVMWKPRKSLPPLLPNRLRPILMRN